jgi:hypothetical protein
MANLVPGGNAPVASGQLRVDINYSPIPGPTLTYRPSHWAPRPKSEAMATCVSMASLKFWVALFS